MRPGGGMDMRPGVGMDMRPGVGHETRGRYGHGESYEHGAWGRYGLWSLGKMWTWGEMYVHRERYDHLLRQHPLLRATSLLGIKAHCFVRMDIMESNSINLFLQEPELEHLQEALKMIVAEQQTLANNSALSTPSLKRLKQRLLLMERYFIALENRQE